MARQQYLREQVERAERLSRLATDSLTVERLQLFADDCRKEMAVILSAGDPH
jgi:hypothetical protein